MKVRQSALATCGSLLVLSGAILCLTAPAAADFSLIPDPAQPALAGEVSGSAPIETVAGRAAARFGNDAWVTIPAADYFDPLRGGIDVLLCPDWSPEQQARHTIFHVGENDAYSHFTLFKTESPAIRFVVKHDPNTYATIDYPIAGWQPGQWHRIRISWMQTGDRLLTLMQIDDGPVRHFVGGKPLETVPPTAYIGRRGPAPQFANAAIAQLALTKEPILEPPFPAGKLPPVAATIDAEDLRGPVRRIHDCTTIWNTRERPIPFTIGDAKWQRFKQAEFSLARLVAFSENWLWGTRVERNAEGKIELDFTDFDKLIDIVRAAGAEPYVRLAYHMPRALSSEPDSPDWAYAPPRDPAEWDEMIRAIVHHLNVERKLGVKYFVCTLNEADIAVSKHGSKWEDILDLHERTVRVAKSVDPSIKIGGPAICQPLEGVGGQCLRDFVRFSRERNLPLDFICFHRYHRPHPRDYEAHLEQVQQIVKQADPDLKPEWFCDEYSLWARDHTADDEFGAAYLASATHYWDRAGLDKISLVSFNGILPPDSPPAVVTSRQGPFDKEGRSVERFIGKQVDAGGVKMAAILAHPPAPQVDFTFGRYRVDVPAEGNPRLMFSTGIGADYQGMDGVGFTITANEPGAELAAAQIIFDHDQRQAPWEEHVVSLKQFTGKTIDIELRTDRGRRVDANGTADHASWGQPCIVTGREGDEIVAFDFIEHIGEATAGTGTNGWHFKYDEETIARSTGLPLIKGPVVTAPYFTVLLMNKLQGDRLQVGLDGDDGILADDSLGIQAATDGKALRALVWSFAPLAEGERTVSLTLRNLPADVAGTGKIRVKRWLIDATHTNPWYEYAVQGKQGGPEYNLNTGEVALVADEVSDVDGDELELQIEMEGLAVTMVEVMAEGSSPPAR